MTPSPHWPEATYRVQFHPEHFKFRDAADLAAYLAELGVSHLYASPYFKAHAGSPHGYDVVDPNRLNPELGSDEDYAAMVRALTARGLGQLLDFVPNHMGIVATENAWWNDVLENGPASPYAGFFDIDWHPVQSELENKVLLPMLGSQYGDVLESGQLRAEYAEGGFFVRYFDARLPLDPCSFATFLKPGLEELKEQLGADSADLRELESILTASEYLPTHTETAPERIAERQREKEVIKGRICRLLGQSPAIATMIRRNVDGLNGAPGDPHSFDRLDELLDAQVYRLSHWKAAADEINYRRFFDINTLAALSTEDRQVFDAIHRFVFELLVRGDVAGLRIDHIDGLYDPLVYLQRLQDAYAHATGKPLYVVVEKILNPEEPLPTDWPVAGTTGYDFLTSVNRLLVDPAGLAEVVKTYERFIGRRIDFREVAYQSKLLILRVAMSSDLQLLAHRLNQISERHRRSRDFTMNTLRTALREILACFPVYRTYIHHGHVSEQDRQFVQRAVAQAKRRNPAADPAVYDFIRGVLLLEQPPELDDEGRQQRELFVGRFQQVTSPLMAKGVEDTAFYVYFPLASLDDVGGDPTKGTIAVDQFHRENVERQAERPGSLLATTTHDTKRSEDVRARINVLAEMPRQWRTAVNLWARLNRRHRREVDGQPAPSRNDEYLFYQTLVGAWPIHSPAPQAGEGNPWQQFVARIAAYMEKATHEAKQRTSWINPNAEYDAAVQAFVAGVLDPSPKNRFPAAFRAFHERVLDAGLYTALSQAMLKLAAPGVPDIYQGQELWDFSLVDPDSRRPVDFGVRRELLANLKAETTSDDARLALARRLARNPRDPRLKLLATWQALQFRRRNATLFREGRYLPLEAEGRQAACVCAFAWRYAPPGGPDEVALVIVPRFLARLTHTAEDSAPTQPPLGPDAWSDTRVLLGDLAGHAWQNVFTGQPLVAEPTGLSLSAALADFPVALVTNRPKDP